MSYIDILGKKHSIPILIALYKSKSFEKGIIYQQKLKTLIGRKADTIRTRLFELKDVRLIDFEFAEEFQHKEYIWLTEKGKKIAEKLVEIEKIVNKK